MFLNRGDGTSSLKLHGTGGALLSGSASREAAVFVRWRIVKFQNEWILRARLARVNQFEITRRGLLFTAPREKGWWAWAVLSATVAGDKLHAKLGPPEQ